MENLNSVIENSANVEIVKSAKEIKADKAKEAKRIKAEQKKADEGKENKNLLDALNAVIISEKAEKSLSGKKSIFKIEYNSKNKRSAIRKKLFGSDASFGLLELYLKNLKEGKKEDAEKCFETISNVCKDAYISEIEFSNYNQYATDNLNLQSLNILKGFINVRKALIIK